MRWLTVILLAASLAGAARTHLVGAGVERYDDPNIAALRYSVADVKALAAAFADAGVAPGDMSVLTSDQADRFQLPTRNNILAALGRVKARAAADDTLIFLFSGHGVQKEAEPYLLPVDTQRAQLEDTALPMGSLERALAGFPGRNILFLIDACRNDPDGGKAVSAGLTAELARGLRPTVTGAGAPRQPNIAVMLACDIGQRAWEMPDQRHGAFTYYLLQGLQGAARSAAGTVTVSSLAQYVTAQVQRWARLVDRAQVPRLASTPAEDFVIATPAASSDSGSGSGGVTEIPAAATLRVVTVPAGATVLVDDQVVGTTPVTVRVAVPAGRTRQILAEVRLDGYAARAARIDLTPGVTRSWVNVELQPDAQPVVDSARRPAPAATGTPQPQSQIQSRSADEAFVPNDWSGDSGAASHAPPRVPYRILPPPRMPTLSHYPRLVRWRCRR